MLQNPWSDVDCEECGGGVQEYVESVHLFYIGDEDTMRCCWQHLWRGVECEECGGGDQEYLEYVNLPMSETNICNVVAKAVVGS